MSGEGARVQIRDAVTKTVYPCDVNKSAKCPPIYTQQYSSNVFTEQDGKPFEVVITFDASFDLYSAHGVSVYVAVGQNTTLLERENHGQTFWLDEADISSGREHVIGGILVWETDSQTPSRTLPLLLPEPDGAYRGASSFFLSDFEDLFADQGCIIVQLTRRRRTPLSEIKEIPTDIRSPPNSWRTRQVDGPKVWRSTWHSGLESKNGKENVFEFRNLDEDVALEYSVYGSLAFGGAEEIAAAADSDATTRHSGNEHALTASADDAPASGDDHDLSFETGYVSRLRRLRRGRKRSRQSGVSINKRTKRTILAGDSHSPRAATHVETLDVQDEKEEEDLPRTRLRHRLLVAEQVAGITSADNDRSRSLRSKVEDRGMVGQGHDGEDAEQSMVTSTENGMENEQGSVAQPAQSQRGKPTSHTRAKSKKAKETVLRRPDAMSPAEWNQQTSRRQRMLTHVGRINETDDGVVADQPCKKCKEEEFVCRVYNEAARERQWKPGFKCSNCRLFHYHCVDQVEDGSRVDSPRHYSTTRTGEDDTAALQENGDGHAARSVDPTPSIQSTQPGPTVYTETDDQEFDLELEEMRIKRDYELGKIDIAKRRLAKRRESNGL